MTDIATISLRVNTGSLQQGSKALGDFRKTASEAATSADSFNKQANQSLDGLTSQLTTAKSLMMSLAGTMGGAFAVSSIVAQADAWGQTVSRLKMVTSSTEELAQVQSKLMEISDRTFKSIDEQTELFIRTSSSMKELGYSAKNTVDFIDSVSSSLTINAANAEQGARAVTALSRAMVSGKLRGLEWEAVMEVMPTAIGDVAKSMGITENAVKSMARNGELSMKQFVSAMLDAQEKNAELTEAMPTTIEDALTRVNNHFRAYIGNSNQAYGVTTVFSNALIVLSDHIEEVANVAAILAGVGLARYFGNLVTSMKTSVTSSMALRNEQLRLAQAEVAGATATAKLAAEEVVRARVGYIAARSADARRQAEMRLTAAQTAQVSALNSVNIAQAALNRTRSLGATILSRGMGLIGGVPGLILLAAGAITTWRMQVNKATQDTRDYIAALDEMREKVSGMKLTEAWDSLPKTDAALALQTKEVQAQVNKIKEMKGEVTALQNMLANPGLTVGGYMVNHLMSVSDAIERRTTLTQQLVVEEDRLSEAEGVLNKIQEAKNDLLRRQRQLMFEATQANNAQTNSVLLMTGEHSAFNSVLSLGNQLLRERASAVRAPMSLPQDDLTKEQSAALKTARREKQLAGTKGEREKQQLRTDWKLEDLGLDKNNQQQSKAYNELRATLMDTWQLEQDNKPATKGAKGGKSEAVKTAEKLESSYQNIIKQQKQQLALDGQHTEVAKIRYQLTEGELSTLTETQKATVLQNAALIDQANNKRVLVEYQRQLNEELENARESQNVELQGFGMGDKARERMQDELALRKEYLDKDRALLVQYQDGKIETDLYQKQIELNRQYLDTRLADQKKFWEQMDEQEKDWAGGMQDGLANWVNSAQNYAQQAANATQEALSGMVDNIADALNDSEADWKDWTTSVLKSIEKILINAMLVEGLKSAGNAIGGGFGEFIGSLIPNAKGGVYDSPSLSAYSNQIVDKPTLFAFAKGGGLMGEAGPEAIMPLTRTSNGQLGVKAAGGGATASAAPVVYITISEGSTKTSSSTGWEGFASEIGAFVDQRYRENMSRDTAPGGAVWNMANGSSR